MIHTASGISAALLMTNKKAYRALSRKYRPDANINNPNKDQAEAKFKRSPAGLPADYA